MNLWKRLKEWREARKAERQALGPARKQGLADAARVDAARWKAEAFGIHEISSLSIASMAASGGVAAPGGADCGPAVSGDCGGMAV